MNKTLKGIAIVVLIAGIIFAFIGHGARTGSTSRELKELIKERNEYIEKNREWYEKHLESYRNSDFDHDPEKCETCGSYDKAEETFNKEKKTLEEAQTTSLMEALGSCLWYVIGCSLLFCVAEVVKGREDY